MPEQPGLVVLFGSGETSASGRKIYDWLLKRLTPPISISILETPAGFELNSAQVAGQVAEFLYQRLQNYSPQITVIPARKRGTPFSPDNPDIIAPLLQSNVIFLGPGSPTYAVRQLQGSLAWHTLVARHRLGAALVLASAATLAASAHTLPVYEIYKVGEDLHWQSGLDFFKAYGLSLVFIPHWNNTDGGASLDTSHCFMGQARFEQLLALLPPDRKVIGLDEHTALVLDFNGGTGQVMGHGGVTLLQEGSEQRFASGQIFPLTELGPLQAPQPDVGLPGEVWRTVQTARFQVDLPVAARPEPPPEVLALLAQRQAARARREWTSADALRQQMAQLGWQVLDTPSGPQLEQIS
jgi:cyanophycinase-like exopeptidase